MLVHSQQSKLKVECCHFPMVLSPNNIGLQANKQNLAFSHVVFHTEMIISVSATRLSPVHLEGIQ